MPVIKSKDDLKKFQEDLIQKRIIEMESGKIQINVGIGACGIASGALNILNTIHEAIQSEKLQDVYLSEIGCIGLCKNEPIVQVKIGNQPKVTYGKVTPEFAQKIVTEHVHKGKIINSNLIQI